MTTRHIGGSLLPSSDPRILTPIECEFGTLLVRPLPKEDTHALILKRGDTETVLASHPNGYSCHSLAERIISGNHAKISEQAEYIVACGGMSLSVDGILRRIKPWATIYFFDGEEVKSQEVLAADLPALSGGKTYWRESMTEEERGRILKAKCAERMGSQV